MVQTAVVHKHEFWPRKEEGNGSQKRRVSQGKGKKLTRLPKKTDERRNSLIELIDRSKVIFSYEEKTGNGEAQHPNQVWKTMIGTSDFLQVIEGTKTNVQAGSSSSKKAGKQFIRSPERGFGNISKGLSKIKSAKIPSATNGSGLPEMNALLFPCLVIGFTAWWGLLPDQVIMTAQNLSLLDPECIQAAKEALIESAPGIGTSGIEQAFDPLKLKGSPEGGEELKNALKEINSAIREQKYAPVVAILMGAAVMQVLLSGSGSGTG